MKLIRLNRHLIFSLLFVLSWLPRPMVAASPDFPDYLKQMTKAEQLYREGKTKELLPNAREAVKGLPNNPDAWAMLAESEFLNGNWKAAIDAYKRCIELGPSVYRWRHLAQVGRAYAELGDKAEAFTWLNKALEDRYQERDDFQKDPHLLSLRNDSRFTELAGLPPKSITSRTAKWKYDFEFYKHEVLRLHPNPYFRMSKSDFDSQFSSLVSSIDKKSDEELLVALQSFSGRFGDGHTNGYLYAFPIFKNNLLPFRFAFFGGDTYIVDAAPGYERYYGAKVESIGGAPGSKILPAITAFVGRDNDEGWPKEWGAYQLRVGYVLQALTHSRSPTEFDMVLRRESEPPQKITVKTGAFLFFPGDQGNQVYFASLHPSRLMKNPPLWLASAEKYFWLKEFDSTLYIQINISHDMKDKSLKEFAAEIQSSLNGKTKKTTLIVDVRNNPGGDSFLLFPVTRAIIAFQAANPGNQIFVLTGRRTFSAATNFTTNLNRFTDAIFVGEPPGSSPNNYGETTKVILPFAGARFGVSSFYNQSSHAEDKRRYIAPKWPIALTAKDYFLGKDPILEKLLP